MIAGIIGLLEQPPNETELEGWTRQPHAAATVDRTDYLDGETVYYGEACDLVEQEQKRPQVVETDSGRTNIAQVTDLVDEKAYTRFVADLENRWTTISRSEGEFFWDELGVRYGTIVERAHIDLDAWLDDYKGRDDSECWAVGWSEDGDDEEDTPASIGYHEEANLYDAPPDMAKQFGFKYSWDGYYVRGMLCESGYVAVYNLDNRAQFARWLTDEVLEYAEVPEDPQEVFDE